MSTDGPTTYGFFLGFNFYHIASCEHHLQRNIAFRSLVFFIRMNLTEAAGGVAGDGAAVDIVEGHSDSAVTQILADAEARPKRPPRSERKRLRHEELLLRRKEERKKKKMERKTRLREQRKNEVKSSADWQSKRQVREAQRKRCEQALTDGLKICIDCSMEHLMSEKEHGKLAMQIGRLYGSNIRADNPAHIYLTGLNTGGPLYQECLKKMDGFEKYLVERTERVHTELFPLDKLVYLSPDSDDLLSDIGPEKVCVIGGLVDENIKQSITKSRAVEAQVATARLPIEEHMVRVDQASHSKVLAVNQVFDILLTYLSTRDWKKALVAGVPRRKGYILPEDNT